MKKLALALALMVASSQSFAQWNNGTWTNQWSDTKTSYAVDSTGSIYLTCNQVVFNFDSYMQNNNEFAFIKMRVDKNETSFITGEWLERFATSTSDKLEKRGIMGQMKKGSTMIYAGEDFRGNWQSKKVSLIGLTKALKNLNCASE